MKYSRRGRARRARARRVRTRRNTIEPIRSIGNLTPMKPDFDKELDDRRLKVISKYLLRNKKYSDVDTMEEYKKEINSFLKWKQNRFEDWDDDIEEEIDLD